MHEGFHGEHEHGHTHSHNHEHMHDGVPHTHEHTHEHSHGHVHDGHEHSHEELHALGIPHDHEHGDNSRKEDIALLDFMLHHNIHHTEELSELAGKLREAGLDDAAERISAAVTLYEQGNAELSEALMLIR